MIMDTFDDKTEAIISPENFYGEKEKICDICIITFSNIVMSNILKTFKCEKIAEMVSVGGTIPFYRLNYKGKDIVFYMTMISSTGAGTCIEEARSLIGAKKYIMFASCGCLDKKITAGKTIIPTEAYRETKGNMGKRKKEGCIVVEMECAGVQAVCDFRGLEYYNFLIGGDLLDSQEWDRRILGNDEEANHQLKNFYIALELALRV